MKKDFDKWNIYKKEVNERDHLLTFHEYEIWWTNLGVNIGDEEDGKNLFFERPILILKKFSQLLFIGIPLSTKIKNGDFYLSYKTKDGLEYAVLLSQLRVMSSKRLIRKINKLGRGRVKEIKTKLKILLKLDI